MGLGGECDVDELNELARVASTERVFASCSDFVGFKIEDTRATAIRVKCQFPEAYPADCIEFDIEAAFLSSDTTARLRKAASSMLADLAAQKKRQLTALFTFFQTAVRSNLLLPCADEIRQLKTSLLNREGDSVKVSEKKGLLCITAGPSSISAGEATLEFSVHVPKGYPDAEIHLEADKSAFPQAVTRLFFAQAADMVRRAVRGIPFSASLRDSDPARPSDEVVRLSVVQARRDVQYLKAAGELARQAVDKSGRRDKRRFDKREINREKEQQASEQASNAAMRIRSQTVAVPALLPVVDYLITKFVRLLPDVACTYCRIRLIPPPLEIPPGGVWDADRTYCGHWYHPQCLEKLMIEPPFGLECSADGCTSRLYHPKWTSDTRVLERRWAMAQASKRDDENARDFLGL